MTKNPTLSGVYFWLCRRRVAGESNCQTVKIV